jgi:hypothetical protein
VSHSRCDETDEVLTRRWTRGGIRHPRVWCGSGLRGTRGDCGGEQTPARWPHDAGRVCCRLRARTTVVVVLLNSVAPFAGSPWRLWSRGSWLVPTARRFSAFSSAAVGGCSLGLPVLVKCPSRSLSPSYQLAQHQSLGHTTRGRHTKPIGRVCITHDSAGYLARKRGSWGDSFLSRWVILPHPRPGFGRPPIPRTNVLSLTSKPPVHTASWPR